MPAGNPEMPGRGFDPSTQSRNLPARIESQANREVVKVTSLFTDTEIKRMNFTKYLIKNGRLTDRVSISLVKAAA